MPLQRIIDWDDAYANMAHIPGGEEFIPRWLRDAAAFRANAKAEIDIPYGDQEREKLDLFYPVGASRGLFIFVHGGYWLHFDKSHWSHFAEGALARGMTVCMPSYPLCPDVEIGDILNSVKLAVETCASNIDGPIYLCGHSAGGLIVTMLSTESHGLPDTLNKRINKTVSIAGVHDLRPLLNTHMNERLQLSEQTATDWSPVLTRPVRNAKLICWVGVDERPEFVRQNRLLADMWLGLGASVEHIEEPLRHHFDVIEGLRQPNSSLMRAIFEGPTK